MTERADFEAMMAAYSKVNAARHTELDDFAEGWQARAALSQQQAEPCGCRIGECESKPDRLCRMAVEMREGGHQ